MEREAGSLLSGAEVTNERRYIIYVHISSTRSFYLNSRGTSRPYRKKNCHECHFKINF
jgi:hypothetical protein